MKLEIATIDDITDVINLIKKRICWMNDKGIKQWNTDNYLETYNNDYFLLKVKNSELYVYKSDNKVIGAVVLLNYDIRWNDNLKAIYIHNLVADINGNNIGKNMLIEIEAIAKEKNLSMIRLDCQADNKKLNKFYENLGFKIVGTCVDGDYKGNRLEKNIT